ncbi:MAG TPA: toxin HicA [Geobacter sp.]|nr:toxin HicA [Geobacter sp.]
MVKDHALVKLVGSILHNRKNVSFDELRRMLEGFGFECRQPKGGSSHYIFRKPGFRFPFSIPKARPVNKAYVDEVVKLLALEEWYEKNR